MAKLATKSVILNENSSKTFKVDRKGGKGESFLNLPEWCSHKEKSLLGQNHKEIACIGAIAWNLSELVFCALRYSAFEDFEW